MEIYIFHFTAALAYSTMRAARPPAIMAPAPVAIGAAPPVLELTLAPVALEEGTDDGAAVISAAILDATLDD